MPLGRGPGTATMTHVAASQPLENPQRPDTLKPPLAGSTLPPAGFSPLEKSVSGPVEKKSSWHRSGKCPTHQLCAVHSAYHHAVDPQPRPSSNAASNAVSTSTSWPP